MCNLRSRRKMPKRIVNVFAYFANSNSVNWQSNKLRALYHISEHMDRWSWKSEELKELKQNNGHVVICKSTQPYVPGRMSGHYGTVPNLRDRRKCYRDITWALWPQYEYQVYTLLALCEGIDPYPKGSHHKASVMRKAFPRHNVAIYWTIGIEILNFHSPVAPFTNMV